MFGKIKTIMQINDYRSVSEKADKQAFADNAFAQAGAANAAVTSQVLYFMEYII